VVSTAPLPDLLGGDQAALRRMKRTATGLLVAVAGVFLLTFALPDTLATGFLRAAAEAGMVGGIADWFAVTALFRHPLGVPVPHTALVARKKDELATRLGEFVIGNFLTPGAVAQQVVDTQLVRRVARALAEPSNASAVGAELAAAVAAVLDAVDERAVTEAVLELARRDLDRRSYTPVLGQLLARAVEGQGQRPLVDVGVTRVHAYLRAHRAALQPELKNFLERQGGVVWLLTTDKRVDRLIDIAIALLDEVEHDGAHPMREWIDGMLAAFADDLRYDTATARLVDAQLRALLEDVHLQAALHEVLADALHSVRSSLDEIDGGLHQRLASLVAGAAGRVLDDPALEARLTDRLQRGVHYAVESYGDALVGLIQRTVAGWEARDAATRIEASVGRDLQFIRINGTVVGALVGVLIHLVTLVLG